MICRCRRVGWVLLVVGLAAQPAVASFHGGAGHEGYTATDGPSNVDATVWVGTAPGKTVVAGSSVAVGGGKVFAYTGDAVVCFDRATGGWLWTSPDLDPDTSWSWSSPVYDENTGDVFIGSGTMVYRLDPDTNGSIVWSDPLPAEVANASVLVTPTRVAIHTAGGFTPTDSYIAVYQPDGTPLWSHQHGGGGANAPAFDGFNIYDLVNDATDGNEMRAYDVDGTTQWKSNTSLAYDWFGGITHADGYLYSTTYSFTGDGELIKINASNGADEWTVNVPSGDSTPVVGDGQVIVVGDWADATVTAYTTAGVFSWSQTVGGSMGWQVSAIQAGQYVYVSTGNDVTILDASNGNVVDTSTETGLGGTPVIDNGCILVPGDDGSVYCVGEAASVPDWEQY